MDQEINRGYPGAIPYVPKFLGHARTAAKNPLSVLDHSVDSLTTQNISLGHEPGNAQPLVGQSNLLIPCVDPASPKSSEIGLGSEDSESSDYSEDQYIRRPSTPVLTLSMFMDPAVASKRKTDTKKKISPIRLNLRRSKRIPKLNFAAGSRVAEPDHLVSKPVAKLVHSVTNPATPLPAVPVTDLPAVEIANNSSTWAGCQGASTTASELP